MNTKLLLASVIIAGSCAASVFSYTANLAGAGSGFANVVLDNTTDTANVFGFLSVASPDPNTYTVDINHLQVLTGNVQGTRPWYFSDQYVLTSSDFENLHRDFDAGSGVVSVHSGDGSRILAGHIVPVPEPASGMAAAGIGLLLYAGLRRKSL